MNKWFSHGQEMSDFETIVKHPEHCCSRCMESCINLSGCDACLVKLRSNSPRAEIVPSKETIISFKDYLCTLNINDPEAESTPPYSEETLAAVILNSVARFNDASDIVNYLKIFNFETEINLLVAEYIMSRLKEKTICSERVSDEDSENSDDDKNSSASSEYFDSDES